MTKYNCLIADDNMLERDALEMHLSRIPQLNIVAICEDGFEAQQYLTRGDTDVDIVFSDIEMPDLNGFGLLKSLKKAPVFVFISSHSEYALESFNLDVIDFMVKPVNFERVLKSVNKAIEYIELKSAAESKPVANNTPKESKDNYFFIRESNDLVKILYDEVAYIESMGDFSKLFMTNDKKHITLVSLKNLELQLPQDHFTRIHKQYIINHHHISAISAEEIKIDNKYTLPLSQTLRQDLLNKVVNSKIVTRHIGK